MICKMSFILFVAATNPLKLSKLNHMQDDREWECTSNLQCDTYSPVVCSNSDQPKMTLVACQDWARDNCPAADTIEFQKNAAAGCLTFTGGCPGDGATESASSTFSICTFKIPDDESPSEGPGDDESTDEESPDDESPSEESDDDESTDEESPDDESPSEEPDDESTDEESSDKTDAASTLTGVLSTPEPIDEKIVAYEGKIAETTAKKENVDKKDVVVKITPSIPSGAQRRLLENRGEDNNQYNVKISFTNLSEDQIKKIQKTDISVFNKIITSIVEGSTVALVASWGSPLLRSRNQTWGWGDLHLKDGEDGESKNTNQTWGWGDLHLKDGEDGASKNTNQTWGWGDLHEKTD